MNCGKTDLIEFRKTILQVFILTQNQPVSNAHVDHHFRRWYSLAWYLCARFYSGKGKRLPTRFDAWFLLLQPENLISSILLNYAISWNENFIRKYNFSKIQNNFREICYIEPPWTSPVSWFSPVTPFQWVILWRYRNAVDPDVPRRIARCSGGL